MRAGLPIATALHTAETMANASFLAVVSTPQTDAPAGRKTTFSRDTGYDG